MKIRHEMQNIGSFAICSILTGQRSRVHWQDALTRRQTRRLANVMQAQNSPYQTVDNTNARRQQIQYTLLLW